MIIEIDVVDEISSMLEHMGEKAPKALGRAAKSLGYHIQKEIKKQVRSGAPGGIPFEERIPRKIRRAVQGGRAASAWYGKMANAIGYQYEEKSGMLKIGWTSKTAALYGKIQEEGQMTAVTNEVRKKWRMAGYPLKADTAELDLPPRPIFEPMKPVIEPKITPFVQKKLNDYMTESVHVGQRSRRKYKVY